MPEATHFSDYVKGKVADWGTKIICATGTANLPILGDGCGESCRSCPEVSAPALDPFRNQIVKVANDAVKMDLVHVFVLNDLPKNISKQIASQVCGDYLCSGVSEVCELRDTAANWHRSFVH